MIRRARRSHVSIRDDSQDVRISNGDHGRDLLRRETGEHPHGDEHLTIFGSSRMRGGDGEGGEGGKGVGKGERGV
jgi:hypothetical protein